MLRTFEEVDTLSDPGFDPENGTFLEGSRRFDSTDELHTTAVQNEVDSITQVFHCCETTFPATPILTGMQRSRPDTQHDIPGSTPREGWIEWN